MSIPLLTKGYTAGATVNNYRFVKFSAALTVIQAAETDAIIGVSGDLDMTSGAIGDVVMSGIAEVESYDTITRGDLITSDSVGRAVKATDVMIASSTIYYGGIALESAVAGDIFEMLVVPGKLSKLDGITASAEEVNVLAGVTAGTTTASKGLVVGANKELDTLVIAASGLKIGSGAGTAVTATAAELNVNAGVTAGTATASKTAVLGANKNLDVLAIADGGLSLGAGAGTAIAATAAEINRACDVSARIVDCTASTLEVTTALHDGKIITLSRAAGIALTLPAATGSGTKLTIITAVTVTSNTSTIKVVGNDTMVGSALVLQDGGNTALCFEVGSTDDTITMDGSTTGGIKGDLIELIDIGTDLWFVQAVFSGTGSEATPFSATVTP
jgi:hypothetical protein